MWPLKIGSYLRNASWMQESSGMMMNIIDFKEDLDRLNVEVKYTQISSCAGVLEIENKQT